MEYPFPQLQIPSFTEVEMPQTKPRPKRFLGSLPKGRGWILAILGLATLLVTLHQLLFGLPSHENPYTIPLSPLDVKDFFANFEGHRDCGLVSSDIYIPPPRPTEGVKSQYCPNRKTLLEALSGGGRHGFNTPFHPRGCHYRWYTTPEVCMILSRFSHIVFIGDDLMSQIYAGFNILLRENMALGAFKQWEMSEEERMACRCENQFVKAECRKFAVSKSEEVRRGDAESDYTSLYGCDQTPHTYLHTTTSPTTSPSHLHHLTTLLTTHSHPRSPKKPIPIIHSLSLSTNPPYSSPQTLSTLTSLLHTLLTTTTNSNSKPHILHIAPPAPGPLTPKSALGHNAAIWKFTREVQRGVGVLEGVEVLGLFNATVQDGHGMGGEEGLGLRMGVVGAMMVVNWLAMVEGV
ncbi:MAG: hypothetical protein M1834_003106 [Cirrosporium novae-zelandiae]|nr:MAG: hypothetical protein M1834_003106 [Cirrosporium novae-zelandiae]